MAVAVVRRLTTTLLLAGAALASVGAAPAEEREMLRAISEALTAMAYAASGLCLFAIVWAGFVLMAEGGEERGGEGPRAPSCAPSWGWCWSCRPRASRLPC